MYNGYTLGYTEHVEYFALYNKHIIVSCTPYSIGCKYNRLDRYKWSDTIK